MQNISDKIDLTSYPQLKFKENVLIFNEVLFLYQKHENCQFQYLVGNKEIDQENIEKFQANIEYNNALSKKYGFLYKHIVFPAKPTCFKPRFKKLGIDIRPLFSKAHEHSSVYYPELKNINFHNEDTHCNIIGDLKIVFKLLLDFFPNSPLPNPILRDEIRKLDLASKLDENYTGTKIHVLSGFNETITKSVQNYSIANALIGSSGEVSYQKNLYALYDKRIVIFGDSCFQQIMFNVFVSLFSEVLFFRNPYIMEDIVKCFEPDIVLTGNAERYLIAVPDSRRPIPWFLHYLSNQSFDNQKISQKTFNGLVRLFTEKKQSS